MRPTLANARRKTIACGLLVLSLSVAGCGAGAGAHPRRPPSVRAAATVRPKLRVTQLLGPLRTYIGYVDHTLSRLRPQLTALRRELAAGSAARAEQAWLAAHLTWLELGQDDAAYGAFGALGNQIDGTAAGVVGATASPSFTGFHRVELDLWSHHDLGAAGRDAARLSGLVATLTPAAVDAALPASSAGIDAWVLRCHEILEDALRDSLSENDDYGSHTDLASVGADVAATREMLRVLRPLIEPLRPGLVATGARELTAIDRAVAAAHPAQTPWREPGALPLRRRQALDAAVDAALETLAPVSELMQVGNS